MTGDHARGLRGRRTRRAGEAFTPLAAVLGATLLARYASLFPILRRVTKGLEERNLRLAEPALALKTSEERFRTLVSNIPGAVYRCAFDAEWTMELMSEAIEEIAGYPASDFVANSVRSYASVIHPEDRAAVAAAVSEAVQKGEPFALEYRVVDATGAVRSIYEKGRAVYGAQAEPLWLDGAIFDVTKQRAAEEERARLELKLRQSQKMETIGQLAGGIAHDFNNVLVVIEGYSDLALGRLGPDDPLQKELEEIKRAADRGASLTRQILAFGRRQVLEPRVFDLSAQVAGLEDVLRRLIGEDVGLVTRLDPELGRVKADSGQIEQVLLNLVVNARDAMPKGGTLTVETASVELDHAYAREHPPVQPGSYVMLAVSDSGVGMDEKTKARVFEPFFTTKELGKGTGLGLATVYGVVKQSGGYIWVYSELGLGTTFRIDLPRVEAELDMRAPAAPMDSTSGSETVLLVEDDDAVRALVRTVLEVNGYTVLGSSRGSEALLLFEQHGSGIDLVLTDAVMPEMDGAELFRALRAKSPRLRVLCMSGYARDAITDRGVLEERVPFIQKPFPMGELLRKVREVLDAPLPDTAR